MRRNRFDARRPRSPWPVPLALLAIAAGGCGGDDGTNDPPILDLVTPGCTARCGPGQVCSNGLCVTAGVERGCGADAFGDGLPAEGVLFVDAAATGEAQGTRARPYATIAAALAAAGDGATIAITDGSYAVDLTLDRSVTLRCRCPQKVTLAGTISVKPASVAVAAVIDGCRIAPADFAAPPQAWGACPEGEDHSGVRITSGAQPPVTVVIRESEIAGWCAGVSFNAEAASSSALCLARSHVWGNHKGIEVFNAPLSGITQASDCAGQQEAVALNRNHIEQNEYAGVFTRQRARGIAMQANLVSGSGTLQSPSGPKQAAAGGFGIYLGDTASANLVANQVRDSLDVGLAMINDQVKVDTALVIRDNEIVDNRRAGIALQRLQATKTVDVSGNLVLGTTAAGDGQGGDGIQIAVAQGDSYSVLVRDNTVQDSARNGVLLDGVAGRVESNTIGDSGRFGLLLQQTGEITELQNVFSANAEGDVWRDRNPLDYVGSLPIPLP